MFTRLFKVVTYCEELSPINMYGISTKWSCGVTWQIKYLSPSADIDNTALGKVLTLQEAPKHDPLVKWTTWDHVTIWKIYISTFTRFIANKLGRVLTLGRIFSTQTLESTPTSCFFFLNSLDGQFGHFALKTSLELFSKGTYLWLIL